MQEHEVGIYIDVDNFTIPLDGRPDRIREGLRTIIGKAESEGEIAVARAYANYANHPAYLLKSLCAQGIEMLFTPPLNGSGKNIDDQEMAKDITLIPYTRPEVNCIIVVSADGHFVPAVCSIRRHGCRTIVMCTDKPNAVLEEAADEVVMIGGKDQVSRIPKKTEELTEDILVADIERMTEARGVNFDRRSLTEVLKSKDVYDGEQLEKVMEQLIHKGVIEFSMSNHGGKRSPSFRLARSAGKQFSANVCAPVSG